MWVLIAFVSAVAVAHSHPAHSTQHNQADEWSDEQNHDDLGWPTEPDEPEHAPETKKYVYHWVDDDVVEKYQVESDGLLKLPGGCELTPTQYLRLQDFWKNNDYVEKCYCQEGVAYCKLKESAKHVKIT